MPHGSCDVEENSALFVTALATPWRDYQVLERHLDSARQAATRTRQALDNAKRRADVVPTATGVVLSQALATPVGKRLSYKAALGLRKHSVEAETVYHLISPLPAQGRRYTQDTIDAVSLYVIRHAWGLACKLVCTPNERCGSLTPAKPPP